MSAGLLRRFARRLSKGLMGGMEVMGLMGLMGLMGIRRLISLLIVGA